MSLLYTSNDAIPAQYIALYLDHILELIFKNLPQKDLGSCRQVNQMWNREATKFFLKFPTTSKALWNIKNDGRIYYYSEEQPDPTQSTELFSLEITSPVLFPCNNLGIQAKDLSEENIPLKYFIATHGKRISSMSVVCKADDNLNVKNFDTLLIKYLPNLQKITLYNIPHHIFALSTFRQSRKLPKLWVVVTMESFNPTYCL